MKLALFGHGGMGRLVADRARAAGDEIGALLTSRDAGRSGDDVAELVRHCHVAIDFSVPEAVLAHVTACARGGIPLVEGTTGWRQQEDEVRRAVGEGGGALVFGANFSLGVNLFYRLVAHAAELYHGLGEYDTFIEEGHHARKRDAPSGTALRLRDVLSPTAGRAVPIASTRAGAIPGTHRVGFDSVADQITLTHTARSREGFAAGALLAARWAARRPGIRGVYAFEDIVDEVLATARRSDT